MATPKTIKTDIDNFANNEKQSKRILKLKKQVSFYEKLFSGLNAVVFVLDLTNEKFLWISDYHKKLLGNTINLKKHCSKDMLALLHPDDRDLLVEMKDFFANKKRGLFTSIYRINKPDGESTWVYTTAKAFKFNKDNNTFDVIGVTVDFSLKITYTKHIKNVFKEKLHESNIDLINVVSRREREIIQYFANGYKTKEIAKKLDISFHTVNNHRKNVLRKLNLRNLASLVNFAVENGLD